MTADTRSLPQVCNTDGDCRLCADDASVGRIAAVDGMAQTALVEFESGTTIVALDLVDACVGDEVLVHMGFAIQRVSQS